MTFREFLRRGVERGGFETDDVLAALVPLFEQVAELHRDGRVAPLDGTGALEVEDGRVRLTDARGREPRDARRKVERLLRPHTRAFDVVERSDVTLDVAEGGIAVRSRIVVEKGNDIAEPAYVTGYTTWEHALGHHDELTDILSLGLLLASVACEIDLSDLDEVETFAASRGDLFALNPRLHPVVARVIREMTELDRHRRAQDLPSLVSRLEAYRDQPVDLDFGRIPGLESAPVQGKRTLILTHLRDRLFEITRRNRLIHHKSTLSSLNLTEASVPVLLDVRNIRAERLMTWQPSIAEKIVKGDSISLGSYLRFEDAPYLPSVLDKLIAAARRDRAEFGFAQLRLVVCFLRWRNLKEAKDEPISSPLLLLPVELVKRRGVRDAYVMTATTSEAEVNPALRHHLRQLYDLELPETVDLKARTVQDVHAELEAQIAASEPGVTLRLVEQPRIELMRERARMRIEQHRRRRRASELAATRRSFDYSYDRDNLRPLGIQLFLERVKPAEAPMRDITEATATRQLTFVAPTTTVDREREVYALADPATGSPYEWEVDLTALTLENFNYRKMTLVRDYAALVDGDVTSPSFDHVFSLEPRPPDEHVDELPLREQFLVVPADASQIAAIARARTGASMIVQGPPGTGKSQTITNLIADYVARGKRVLFVAEKRAAIDVVHHRLRQEGLEELCTLIHDSQKDKRAFVHSLRDTFTTWMEAADAPPRAEEAREREIAAVEAQLEEIAHAQRELRAERPELGTTLAAVIERLAALREAEPALTPAEEELLPPYAEWRRAGPLVQRLADALAVAGAPVLARHPLRFVHPDVLAGDRPVERLTDGLRAARPHLDRVTAVAPDATVADARAAAEIARVADAALLDPGSRASKQLDKLAKKVAKAEQGVDAMREKTTGWREPLEPADARAALEVARQREGSALSFLSGEWRRVRTIVRERYDFSRHAVAPRVTQVLVELVALHEAQAELAALLADGDARELVAELEPLRDAETPLARATRERAIAGEDAAPLAAAHDDAAALDEALGALLTGHDELSLRELAIVIADVEGALASLRTIAPLLTELDAAAPALARAVRRLDLEPDALEAATARRALADAAARDRALDHYGTALLNDRSTEAATRYGTLLRANAATIRERSRTRFLERVRISTLPAAQLTPEQKAFKKRYAAGRRVVEHEFGKTMRYRAIRDLAADETGEVVADLKPIWLMSPLSVSDTLPLEPDSFDVVIFDEASQIPIEDAVPALYRACQAIVVGDRMQLPPTQFFSARADGEELVLEEEGERFEVTLDADSFLTQADVNLPSTLLSWHYRSRSESLIAFSNAAFYGGRLATIPDRVVVRERRPELRVVSRDDAARHAPELVARPVSFHFLEHGVYENRRNEDEAAYIASLVRELLLRHAGGTIGIVAFSEAQQSEIEDALALLAARDEAFAARLEDEYVREEDDQFVGLFVKNLENVQGDERDVILMSVCYGRDANGRMRMNFGPINQPGGERRLNVIFSRARRHMAVVSSIRDADITNTYNDGANTLRLFLRYAELSSTGDPAAGRVLQEVIVDAARSRADEDARGAIVADLAAALRGRGIEVDTRVGRSRFRCDLALREPGADAYALAALVDLENGGGTIERQVLQPNVLRAFGWNVEHVAAKDWVVDADALADRLARRVSKLSSKGTTRAWESESHSSSSPSAPS